MERGERERVVKENIKLKFSDLLVLTYRRQALFSAKPIVSIFALATITENGQSSPYPSTELVFFCLTKKSLFSILLVPKHL